MDFIPLTFPIQEYREDYARLIPPQFQSCLDGKDPFELPSLLIGIGILKDQHPIGISIACVYRKVHAAHILVFNIENLDAHEDAARQLLRLLDQQLLEKNILIATFTYPQKEDVSSIIEKIFIENHWQGPQLKMIECLFISADFNPTWLHNKIDLDSEYEEFLFKDITQKEKKELIHRFEQMTLSPSIFPFGREKNLIEYKNSLGLRYKGKVIGWMLTHRIKPDTIRYSALYLDEEFRHTRYWFKLLIDAIKIQKSLANAKYAFLEINLEQISKSWLKFIERKLFPQACKIMHINMFWKSFK